MGLRVPEKHKFPWSERDIASEEGDDNVRYFRSLIKSLDAMYFNLQKELNAIVTSHLGFHDGETLQLDAIDSDGGAFSFSTTGDVTFNQNIEFTGAQTVDGVDVSAHKDRHDPEDGADPLDCAAAAEISVVVAASEGSAHSFARSDHVHAINHGITDNHIVTIDGTANANEHAVFSANGIAGLTDTELIAALSGDAGAAFDWNGQNLTGVGTIASGGGTLTIDETHAMTDYLLADGSRALGGRWDMFADVATDRWDDADSNTIFGIDAAGADNLSGAVSNAIFGHQAGYNITSGDYNVLIGAEAGYTLTNQNRNIAIGYKSLYNENDVGVDNVALGYWAGYYSNASPRNVYVGSYAGIYQSTGFYNTFVGYKAGGGYTSPTNAYSYNVMVGCSAGEYAISDNNVILGYSAGYNVSTGGNNILIGFQAGDNLTTGTDNIIVGHDLNASANNVSNELNIGDVYKGVIDTLAATLAGTLVITTVADAGADVDKFLVLDAGNMVDYRTGAEVLSDISGDCAGDFNWNNQDIENINQIAVGFVSPMYDIESRVAAGHGVWANRVYSDGVADTPYMYFMKSHTDTISTYVETITNDMLGEIGFYGVDTVPGMSKGAKIYAKQNAAAGAMVPTDLVIAVCNDTNERDPVITFTYDEVTLATGVNLQQANADETHYLGRCAFGFIGAGNEAGWQHRSLAIDGTNYALKQLNLGDTYLNCSTSKNIFFRRNNVTITNLDELDDLTDGGETTLHTHPPGDPISFDAVNAALAAADAPIDINGQNFTSVGTIGCGTITTTGNIVLPANGVIGVTDGNPQIVFDNANNWLEITGRVGIGTVDPATPLEVAGNIQVTSAAPGFVMQETDAGDQTWQFMGVGGEWRVRDISGGTYPIRVEATTPTNTLFLDSTGRIGLGLTSPLAQLHVDQSVSDAAIPVLMLDQGDVSEQCIKFSSDSTDRDVHLFTVDVTGTPAMDWDETNDRFSINKGIDFNSQALTGVGAIGCGAITLGGDLTTDRWDSSATNTLIGVAVCGAGNLSGAIENTIIGNLAGNAITSGDDNTCIGYRAGLGLTTGERNVFVGSYAATAISDGNNNFAMGYGSLNTETSGTDNVAVGSASLNSQNGGVQNVGIGRDAGYFNQTGDLNTSIGYHAGKGATGQSNERNTLIGARAGFALTTGSNNVCIGYSAGDVLTTGASNIIIGYGQDPSAAGASSEINIGGTIFGKIDTKRAGVNVAAPLAQLHVDQSVDDAAIPVLILDQADVDEDFIHFIGTGAAGPTLTNNIVDNDGVTPTLEGWFKIYIEDVGDQVADGHYFVPFYSLA